MFSRSADREITAAHIMASLDGQDIGALTPRRDYYPVAEQPMTIPAVRSTLREDLYVILAGWEGKMVTLKAYVNPLVMWIWIGTVLFIVGTVVAAWPEKRPLPVASRRYAPAIAGQRTAA
jgi:cytochrome c-type biogenesis protein CcmF